MAIFEDVKRFFTSEPVYRQGDFIQETKKLNPSLSKLEDKEVANILLSKHPDKYPFLGQFNGDNPVPAAFVPKSKRTDRFYEENPEEGIKDAKAVLSLVRENFPQYKDIDDVELAGSIERRFPERHAGLSARLAAPVAEEEEPEKEPLGPGIPGFKEPELKTDLAQGTATQATLAGAGTFDFPSQFKELETVEGQMTADAVKKFLIEEPAKAAPVVREYLADQLAGTLAGDPTTRATREAIEARARKTGKVPVADVINRGLAEIVTDFIPLTPAEIATFAGVGKALGAGFSAFAKTRLGQASLRQVPRVLKQYVQEAKLAATTKQVKKPIGNQEVKDFFVFGRDKLDPEVYQQLLKVPQEQMIAAIKARQGVTVDVRVPRFGGKKTAVREAPGAAQPPSDGVFRPPAVVEGQGVQTVKPRGDIKEVNLPPKDVPRGTGKIIDFPPEPKEISGISKRVTKALEKRTANGLPRLKPNDIVSRVDIGKNEVLPIRHEEVMEEAKALLDQALLERGEASALEKFVMSNKIRANQPDPITGKVPEAEENLAIPVRFKSKQGSPIDEVAQSAFDAGIIAEASDDLLREKLTSLAVRGRKPNIAEFYDEALRAIEFDATEAAFAEPIEAGGFGSPLRELPKDLFGQPVKPGAKPVPKVPESQPSLFDKQAKPKFEVPPKPESKAAQEQVEGFGAPETLVSLPEGARVQPAPIAGLKPKSLRNIQLDVSKAVGQKILVAKPAPRSGGTYYPGTSKLVIKHSGDLDTTAHELAHSLDDRLGIVADWNKQNVFAHPFDGELAQFWKHGSVAQSGPRSTLFYKRAEGVAEWMRAWLVNPEEAIVQAPKFSEFVLAKIPEKTMSALRTFSKDIRSFAGASAHDQIMANVQWEPPDSGFLRFFSDGKSDPGKFQITFWDRLKADWTDSLRGFEKAVEFAKQERGVGDVLPENDPLLLARLYNGIHSKMDEIFSRGMVNGRLDNVTPGGVQWLLGPLDSSSAKVLNAEMQETASLMIAERTIEKAAQLGEFGRVSGIGGGILSDVNVAKKRLNELKSDPQKLDRLREAVKRYREWANANLNYMVEKGRLSKESRDLIVSNNEHYVAMQRVMDIGPSEEIAVTTRRGAGGKSVGTVAEPIQKFKGSTREILNPYTSLMDSTYKTVRESDRNEILRNFVDLLRPKGGKLGEGPVRQLADVARIAATGDKNTIPVFVNGKKEVWQFQPDVLKSLKGIVENPIVLNQAVTLLPRIFRAGIVNFPPFLLRNVVRDFQTRLMVTSTRSNIPDQFAKRGPMDVSNLRKFGGDQFGHYLRDQVDYMRAMQTAIKEVANQDDSIVVSPQKMAKWYRELTISSERVGRMAEWRAAHREAKSKGLDDYNANLFAASKARGLLDFAVAGNYMRVISQLVPFSNAQVQGLRVGIGAAQRDPEGFLGRWALYAVAPAIMTYALNTAKGDLEEYRQLPAWRRDLFYNFKLGPDFWLSVPKAFDMGVLSTGVERSLDFATGNKRAFEGYTGSLVRGLFPVDESAIAGPFRGLIQVLANKDFFRDRTIIPRFEENLDVRFRDTSKASRLGKAIQKGVGVDARNVDFMMREMFGFFGSFATKASDIGREDKRAFSAARETGFFRGSPSYAARDVQWVFEFGAKNGLTQTKDYKFIKTLLSDYFEARTPEDKQLKGQELVNEAQIIRGIWEENPPLSRTRRIRDIQLQELEAAK